jgi:hypothetical protein
MNVALTIGRVVLDGVPPEAARRPELRAALGAELTRLIAEGGLPPALAAGGAVPQVRARGLRVPPGGTASAWGVAIARSIYGGMWQ